MVVPGLVVEEWVGGRLFMVWAVSSVAVVVGVGLVVGLGVGRCSAILLVSMRFRLPVGG